MFRPTVISTSAPTVNDDFDAGYRQGIGWFNTSTSTFYICDDDSDGAASWTEINTGLAYSWSDYTPTFTPTGGTVTGASYVARYISINNLVSFYIDYSGTADGDITDMKITLPSAPADNDCFVPVMHYYLDNGSYGIDNIAYIDMNDNTEGNRKIAHARFQTLSSGVTFRLFYSGFYEEKSS